MIYCTRCKYHVRYSPHGVVWCASPKNGIDLTDGSAKTMSASINRGNDLKCGESAMWFKADNNEEHKPASWWELFWSWRK